MKKSKENEIRNVKGWSAKGNRQNSVSFVSWVSYSTRVQNRM